MNKSALQEIDFYRVRDQVAAYCTTQEAKELFLQREPLTEQKQIELLKNLSREWAKYLSASRKNPVLFWEPVAPLIDVIKANGTSLVLEQVKTLGQFVQSVNNLKQCISRHAEELELKNLLAESEKIPDFSQTEKLIFHIIIL